MTEASKPFTFSLDRLPARLPLFSIPDALLLPSGQLPLQVYEPRYLAMVEDALSTPERLIGVAQLTEADDGEQYAAVGCAGRIVSFTEEQDNRMLIMLSGICRFRISRELDEVRGYKVVAPDWSEYVQDMAPGLLDSRHGYGDRLREQLENQIGSKQMLANWDSIKSVSDKELLALLAMMLPFSAGEKQELLEITASEQQAARLLDLIELDSKAEQSTRGTFH